MDLAPSNQSLRARGVRLALLEHKGRLYLRGTLPQVDGSRKQQRVPLHLPALPSSQVEAELRALQLHQAVSTGAYPSKGLPWAQAEIQKFSDSAVTEVQQTVEHWCHQLEQQFWTGRVRSSAAKRTWDRIRSELQRLPAQATLTIDLLVAVAATTTAGSRTRLEACKVFKRLGKVAGLEGLDQLDALRGSYEPAERQLPSDQELADLLERIDHAHQYAWITWALITFGCRPAEVFSLRPKADKTAQVLSVKRKGKAPTWRTALALPVSPLVIERSVPWDVESPSQYDSERSMRLVQAWGKWMQRWAPGLQLYAIRHAWAVRTIRLNLNASLAAKTMGHSLAVHHSTYHRWLDQSDIAAVAAGLR